MLCDKHKVFFDNAVIVPNKDKAAEKTHNDSIRAAFLKLDPAAEVLPQDFTVAYNGAIKASSDAAGTVNFDDFLKYFINHNNPYIKGAAKFIGMNFMDLGNELQEKTIEVTRLLYIKHKEMFLKAVVSDNDPETNAANLKALLLIANFRDPEEVVAGILLIQGLDARKKENK